MNKLKDLIINLILDIVIVLATVFVCAISIPLGIISFVIVVVYKISETIGLFVRDLWLGVLDKFNIFLHKIEEREKDVDEEGE